MRYCFLREWDVQDLEGLGDAVQVTPAAATGVYGLQVEQACGSSSGRWVHGFCDGDFAVLVGGSGVTALLVTPAAAMVYVCWKWSKLAVAATAAAHEVCGYCHCDSAFLVGVFMLTLLVVLDGVCMLTLQTILDGGFAVLEGFMFVLDVYLCLLGGRSPREDKVFEASVFFICPRQSCQVDCCRVHDQGTCERGAVSRLLTGVGQASGRVDVPNGTKIEAAAASQGTSRFRPWNADAGPV